MTMSFTITKTLVGRLLLAGEGGTLTVVKFLSDREAPPVPSDWVEDAEPFRPVLEQLDAYFRGERRTFDVAIRAHGTAFEKQVWQELRRIPYGETASYAEIAQRIGRPGAFRAVGAANRKNPLAIVVPCHRVIGADGSLVGFAGGLPIKQKLLELEGARREPQRCRP